MHIKISSISDTPPNAVTFYASSSSQFNIFGCTWRKSCKFNDLAKAGTIAITKKEVCSLFNLGNSALLTQHTHIVASCYTRSPVLLSTVLDQACTNFDSIKDYFNPFLKNKLQDKIIGKINIGDGWSSHSGIYDFTIKTTGDKVQAHYTYNTCKRIEFGSSGTIIPVS